MVPAASSLIIIITNRNIRVCTTRNKATGAEQQQISIMIENGDNVEVIFVLLS